MRSILRTLPIRWQITLLHAAILALVLALGGLGLWNAQYTFQYNTVITRHTAEMRALIPDDLNGKVRDLLFVTPPLDRARLKELYPKIVAEVFPPSQDPTTSFKKLGLLNPKLADGLLQQSKDPDVAGKQALDLLPQLGSDDLFPPGERPADTAKKLAELSPSFADLASGAPQIDQAALKQWAADLVQKLSAKDSSAVIFTLDGAALAQSGYGPVCALPAYVSKADLSSQGGDVFWKKLRDAGYFEAIGGGQLSLLMPVVWMPEQNRPVALAQVCVPTDSIDAGLNQLAISLAVGWLLVVGVAAALGVTATRRVLQPLDRVVVTAGRIAAGDLQQRVGLPPGQTEIAQLGAAFDTMVARLEEAFTTQRRFVADAAHELRTPLTALSASVELLLIGVAESDRATAQRLLRHLDSELGRVIRLTNDLLTLSRLDARPEIALRPTDLSGVLEAAGEHSRNLLRGQELVVDVAPDLWVQGDPDRLSQVVLNLLDNARKYTPSGGQITLRADRDEQAVRITVQDTGVGIPADALPHLFERFYRVDSARSRASGGSGLGLAIVQAIVQAHRGQVDVQSAPGAGACVTIRLPRLPV